MKENSKGKHPGGRPLKFADAKILQKKIDEYFDECKNESEITIVDGKEIKIPNPQIPTIAGLAYHLGTDRHTIYNYSNKDEFFHTIKKARDLIISRIEKKLVNVNGNIGGTIFLAKNYGYQDKIDHEFTKPMEIIITDYRGKE